MHKFCGAPPTTAPVHADACPSGYCCCRCWPPQLVIRPWPIGPKSVVNETMRYDTNSRSSCLVTAQLTLWSCTAPGRVNKCDGLSTHLKPLLVGRSNQSYESRSRSWNGRARWCGDFLAARRLPQCDPCGSRCARAACKPSCSRRCVSLTLQLGSCSSATGKTRKGRSSSRTCSVGGPVCAHRVRSCE